MLNYAMSVAKSKTDTPMDDEAAKSGTDILVCD